MPASDAGFSRSLQIFRGRGPLLRNLMVVNLTLGIYLWHQAWLVTHY